MANNNTQMAASSLKQFNGMLTNPRTQNYLADILGEKKSAFVNNLTALVANSASLQVCEPTTLLYAGIKATALDLPLDQNLGFAYVIPYKNNKEGVTQAQFQIGYKGFVQLAIRSGQFKTINVTDVREGELEGEDMLTGEIRFKRASGREDKPIIGYAAFFRLTNGFEKIFYMTREEMEIHAKRYSQTYGSRYDNIRSQSKWATDFDAMAKKTVLKLMLSKWAPLSVQMQEAQKADQAVVKADGYEYADAHDADAELAEAKQMLANQEEVVMDVHEATADPAEDINFD